MRGVGLNCLGDIAAGELDIHEHAGGVKGAGLGAALLEASKSASGSAYGSKSNAHAEHICCGFILVGIECEGNERGVGDGALYRSGGYGRGSTHPLDDGG